MLTPQCRVSRLWIAVQWQCDMLEARHVALRGDMRVA
jgi:hypothetical protein